MGGCKQMSEIKINYSLNSFYYISRKLVVVGQSHMISQKVCMSNVVFFIYFDMCMNFMDKYICVKQQCHL